MTDKWNNYKVAFYYGMESMMLKLFNRTTMNHIQSPFLKDIPQCKTVLRKLRKKIYKYSSVHRLTKKPKDTTHDIMGLLASRNIPSYVTDSLKKKRTIDIHNIKNVHVAEAVSLSEIMSMASSQEQEISKLFEEHKSRMKKVEKKTPLLKLERKSTTYSSTEGEDSQYSEQYSISSEYDCGQGGLSAEVRPTQERNTCFHADMKHDQDEEQVSFGLQESSHFHYTAGPHMMASSRAFLELEKDFIYPNEQMWLRF